MGEQVTESGVQLTDVSLGEKQVAKKLSDSEEDLEAAYETDAHRLSLKELCIKFGTDLDDGLSADQFEKNLEKYGINQLTPKETEPAWLKWIKSVFTGFFNILLWVGSLLSIGAYIADVSKDNTNLYIGIVLAVVVMITGTFSYFQESKSDAIMEGFKSFLPQEVDVYRDSVLKQIVAADLVPGDLIQLKAGDKLPADVRIITCSKDCQVDNSALTGESEPQDRKDVFTNE
eukprot:477607_1